MIVTKWINIEREVEVRIDAEDIFESLAHLKDYDKNILPAFLSIKEFLDAIKDDAIAQMNDYQREVIGDFLLKSSKRFKHKATDGVENDGY